MHKWNKCRAGFIVVCQMLHEFKSFGAIMYVCWTFRCICIVCDAIRFCINGQNDDHTSYEMRHLCSIKKCTQTKTGQQEYDIYIFVPVLHVTSIRFLLGSLPFSSEWWLFSKTKNKAHTFINIRFIFFSFCGYFVSPFWFFSCCDTRARTLHVPKYLCNTFFQELATCIKKKSEIIAPSVSVCVVVFVKCTWFGLNVYWENHHKRTAETHG